MKKLIFMGPLCSMLLASCAYYPVPTEQNKIEQSVPTEEAQKNNDDKPTREPELDIKLKEGEKELAEKRDTLSTIKVFKTFYYDTNNNGFCANGYIATSDPIEVISGSLIFNVLQTFATPDKHVECYLKNIYTEEFLDTSDSCVLERRNASKSKVCLFNYKKYLPSTSKISTDDEFLYLIDVFDTLYTKKDNDFVCSFCDELPERTSTERQECKKQAENYLTQIVEGKEPLCKNKINKKYMDFLTDGVNSFGFLSSLTQKEIEDSASSTTASIILNNIYQSAYEQAWFDSVKKFGAENFCSMKGYEKDVVQINKKQKNTGRKTITLN